MTFISPRTDGRSHGAEHGSNFERFESKSLFLDLILNYIKSEYYTRVENTNWTHYKFKPETESTNAMRGSREAEEVKHLKKERTVQHETPPHPHHS